MPSNRSGIVAELARLLPADAVATSELARNAYGRDGFGFVSGDPLAIVSPADRSEVAAVVRACGRWRVAVVPRGAGTGRTGGAVPLGDSVVISMARMRRFLAFDDVDGFVQVEAGVRNLEVSAHVRDAGWCYAPDPSSRRTCTIGGNIATNASGAGALRRGTTASHLAAVTVVLPGGEIAEFGSAAFDGAGADVAALFCGAEGMLGIVTDATLRLTPAPPASCSLLFACDGIAEALRVARGILARGLVPLQMDMLDRRAALLCETFRPSGYPDAAMLLVQFGGSAEEVDDAVVAVSAAFPATRVCRTAADETSLWRGRESYYGAAIRRSAFVALDCAVPLGALPDALVAVECIAASWGLDTATFVHATDGTIHAFVFHSRDLAGQVRGHACADAIRVACVGLGGTISAEYGVGIEKQALMREQFSTADLEAQRRVVAAFCGDAPFNPGKVLPAVAGIAA